MAEREGYQIDTLPSQLYGRQSDGTVTKLAVDSDGKLIVSGGGGSSDHAVLTNLPWSVAGHTIDEAVDMDDNDIVNGGTIAGKVGAVYVFEDVTERDAFFVAYPNLLVVDMLIIIKDTTPPPTPGVRNLDFSKAINSQYFPLLYP